MARNEVEGSNMLKENREIHQRTLYLMTNLEDTTSRLEIMAASDQENRVLLEKGGSKIQKLSEELNEAEKCAMRYEKMLEERDSDVKDLSRILATKETELISKDV